MANDYDDVDIVDESAGDLRVLRSIILAVILLIAFWTLAFGLFRQLVWGWTVAGIVVAALLGVFLLGYGVVWFILRMIRDPIIAAIRRKD